MGLPKVNVNGSRAERAAQRMEAARITEKKVRACRNPRSYCIESKSIKANIEGSVFRPR